MVTLLLASGLYLLRKYNTLPAKSSSRFTPGWRTMW
ncbi:MAG: sortase B protein-sorting domain-containing protein [Clostridia bacterium]|nr:sortase B protein-sorting domain-containing protein [Clostridia bacterium]